MKYFFILKIYQNVYFFFIFYLIFLLINTKNNNYNFFGQISIYFNYIKFFTLYFFYEF